MVMAELTYEDYKRRLSIQELLVDAGYRLNRRDGLRYPSYVRIDSDGRRVRGDKFIVTGNGFCCFQPPERKNYNVISFIKEHPHFFAEYTPGMSADRLVNLVCRRLLNEPQEIRETRIFNPGKEGKPFDIDEYDLQAFRMDDWESQKKFYPYFKNRGIDLDTQRAFCGHFFLASRHRTDGKLFTNLAFPLSLPAWPGQQIVGLEERSRPNAEGKTAYKGMAAGSNATEGMWIGRLEQHRSDVGYTTPLSRCLEQRMCIGLRAPSMRWRSTKLKRREMWHTPTWEMPCLFPRAVPRACGSLPECWSRHLMPTTTSVSTATARGNSMP